ncbi:MAG: hypothetical protein ABSH48_18085 [Verrucomicrobiota bacterium]
MFLVSLALTSAWAQTTRTWVGTTSTDWFNATNWVPNGVPATNDILDVTNYADITFSAPVTINGTFNWAGGFLRGQSLTIASNGVLNITGIPEGANPLITVTNQGTVNWLGGSLGLGGSIWNQTGALWNIQCDQFLQGGGGSEFINAGTLLKSVGSSSTVMEVPVLNSGIVSVSQATLGLEGGGPIDGYYNAEAGAVVQFSGAAFSYTTTPVFTGGGAFELTGGSLALVDDVIPNLQMLGGAITLGSNFQGGTITNLILTGSVLSGNHTVSGIFNCGSGLSSGSLEIASGGLMNWSGGYIEGPLTVNSNGTLTINGGSGINGALTNMGTVNWLSGGLELGQSAWNQPGALWNIACDQVLAGGINAEFVNAGTLLKSAGSGSTVIEVPLLNSGVVSISQAVIEVDAGLTNTSGTLNCGLSGANNFGQLVISGSAMLSGAFKASLLDGFVPALNNSFAVVTYGSSNGVFNSVQLPAAAVWQSNYGPTAFTITVAAINKLAIVASPGSTNAGATLAPLVVQIEDTNNNPIATGGVAITVSLAGGSGTLSGTLTQFTDTTGRAMFGDLSVNLSGLKTLLAAAPIAGLSPATTAAFTISPSAAAMLALSTPIASPQGNGYAFSPPPVVQVTDAFGNVVPGASATITAQLISGGGALAGVLGANADGMDGSATFSNLVYHLANPQTAESPVVAFTAPDLKAVTNAPALVRPVFSSIILQDRNSVVQISPANDLGVCFWTVDGVSQLFQHWFWMQGGPGGTTQISFDLISPPYRVAWSSSNAVLAFLSSRLSLQLAFTLQGGATGSKSAVLTETVTLTNLSGAVLEPWLYDYADFDLAGSWTNDTLSFPTQQTAVQEGKGMVATQTVSPSPYAWEGSFYAIILDELDSPGNAILSDSIIPPEAGDQTFAFQWQTYLNPGQVFVLVATNSIQPSDPSLQPVPVSLNLALSDGHLFLSWPTNGTVGCQLQSANQLAPAPDWTAITNVPAMNGQQYQVILPPATGDQFFRLKY